MNPLVLNRQFDGRLVAGDEVPVQITKDAQKTKQASVTSKITLSNDWFVMELGTEGIFYSSKLLIYPEQNEGKDVIKIKQLPIELLINAEMHPHFSY